MFLAGITQKADGDDRASWAFLYFLYSFQHRKGKNLTQQFIDQHMQIINVWIAPNWGIDNVASNVIFTPLQKELHFDDEVVLQQIKHIGILQVVRIQKSGYTAKYSFKVRRHVVKR